MPAAELSTPSADAAAPHDAASERGLRVAIVGAGPSGLFAAQALAGSEAVSQVDVFDRLPTPFGLLRYGVAPDHGNIKAVGDALERVLRHDAVEFYGLVDVGGALPVADLQAAYDAVILAFGAGGDLLLGIPGEELHGSRSGREFVEWYGGHPDAAHQSLSGAESVAVIGVGNVAVDVARVVLKDVAALSTTDMPQDVLDELDAHRDSTSGTHEVYLIGRRGPQHAAFTTKELRELLDLPGLRVTLSEGALDDIDEAALDRRARANVAAIREAAERPWDPDDDGPVLHLMFWHRPARLTGPGVVEQLVVERTQLVDGRLVGTGEETALPVTLVLRAVGYRGSPLAGVPFDAARGVIPNEAGRVLDASGTPIPGLYTSGWIKRGPTGVIGTNKPDAAETVASLLADLRELPRKGSGTPATDLLAARGIPVARFEDWLAIDARERELGAEQGRFRTKVATWEELTALALARTKPTTDGADPS